MTFKSNFGMPFIFLLITLLASPINGRKGPGEYWGRVMKGQPIPEAIEVFVNQGPYEAQDNGDIVKEFINNFDSTTPDVTIIYDDVNPIKVKAREFINDFASTTPDATIIYDDVNPKKSKAQAFFNDFASTTPDVTIVYNDVKPI
ncbi:uncharacterized protein [Spinacia oleracea]|uniref:Uncharacterized protein n=1 Tax=Spinacia oleracea TaxID=3562 RepID=A0A9R0J2T8_SPIOL|nr:uncharacterized protein LOC110799273 [Spinacia oleracea]